MVHKFNVEKILSVCKKHGIKRGGCAYSFGDQKPTFTRDWLEAAKDRIERGISAKSGNSGGWPMGGSEFFKAMGYSDYFDIDYNGKARLLLDLGRPLPNELYNKADILFDGGVLEHIPDIYQAMCNVMLLLKKGGLFIQNIAASYLVGDCYYNIDPTLFRDFYGANGFETIECMLYYKNIKFRRLKFVKHVIKQKLKPFVPGSIMAYRKRIMQEKEAAIPRIYNDDMRSLRFIDPFHPAVRLRFDWYSPPPPTCICYIGIKRRDIKADSIVVPNQEWYPNKLAMHNPAASD